MAKQIYILVNNNEDWAIVYCSTMATFDNDLPSLPIVSFFKRHPVIFPQVVKAQPIPAAKTVFTDGFSSGTATVVSDKVETITTSHKSAQKPEREEIITALQTFPEKHLSIYTDSPYIAQHKPWLETAGPISPQSTIQQCFYQIQTLLWAHKEPLYIGHNRAHSGLPGPLAQENSTTDSAT